MARTLTGLRVKIGLKSNRQADYPDFGSLPVVQASGGDWSFYVDREGEGWHYDQTSGHSEDTPGSPVGQQFGLLIIPEQFAIEAVAAFPTVCTRLTETQTEAFYDNRAHVREADNRQDDNALLSLRQELELLKELAAAGDDVTARRNALRAKLRAAIDPDREEPGIHRNKLKTWIRRKAAHGIVFKEPA